MLVTFPPIFVAETKIIQLNFMVLSIKGRSKVYEKNLSRESPLNF